MPPGCPRLTKSLKGIHLKEVVCTMDMNGIFVRLITKTYKVERREYHGRKSKVKDWCCRTGRFEEFSTSLQFLRKQNRSRHGSFANRKEKHEKTVLWRLTRYLLRQQEMSSRRRAKIFNAKLLAHHASLATIYVIPRYRLFPLLYYRVMLRMNLSKGFIKMLD